MGKVKYMRDVEEFFKKSPVVDYGSIERMIRDRKKVKGYVKKLVRNLMLNGKVKRLTKGYYTIHEETPLIVFCFKPSYLGLQDAMSLHGIWEQETVPIVLTTRKVRTGIRKVMGMNVLIRRIDSKYFFGFDYYKSGDFYFPYSDIEKTLIDMVYFRGHMDKEVVREFKKKIDRKKLNGYLKVYPKKFREKVFGLIG